MSDDAEKIQKLQAKYNEEMPASVKEELEKMFAIDPRLKYPYMSKRDFQEMMEAREKK